MSKLLLGTVLGVSLVFSSIAMAHDAQVKDMLPMSKILQSLQKEGYHVVLKVQLDGDALEAKVVDSKGKELKVNISPETGKITRPKAQATHISIDEAVQKVEEEGYKNIYKVSTNQNDYEMKAYDKEGKRVSLEVDAATGKINKEWF